MMFGLVVIPLTAMVGLAIDFGRAYGVHSHTQAALDAAALAAGRVAQVEKSDAVNKASAAATAYFNQIKPGNVVNSALQFSPNSLQTEFTVTATSWVRTPFLGALNALIHKAPQAAAPTGCQVSYFACVKITTTSTATLKAGGNGAESIELAIMLDVTGSMSGQKLADLKAAMIGDPNVPGDKGLIDIVIWGDQSEYTSKVALAPFSQAVNAGSFFTAVTGLADDPDANGDGYKDNLSSSCYRSDGSVRSSCQTEANKARKYSKCVVERTGTNAFTDAAPSTKYLQSYDVKTGDSLTSGSGNSNCLPATATIVPLTSDKQKLRDMVTSFVANGSTAGHLGTAWAWYLLSPNWANVWPDDSKPVAYGAAKVRKVAVLMTDGEYNIQYEQTSNGSSTTQARTLCTNMKKKLQASDPNIEIYTVGFDLGGSSSAITTLQQCATDASHFYNTSTGDQLKAAFRDIALKISSLRLTN